jgi:hypothetical protein
MVVAMTFNPVSDGVADLMTSETWGLYANSMHRVNAGLKFCVAGGGVYAGYVALADPPAGLVMGLAVAGAAALAYGAEMAEEFAEEQKRLAEQAEAERKAAIEAQREAERNAERARQQQQAENQGRALDGQMKEIRERQRTKEYWKEYKDPIDISRPGRGDSIA